MEIEKDIIDKHREKKTISIEEIKYYSSFEQILGSTEEVYSNDERKQRWDKNMQELRKNGLNDSADYWTVTGGDGQCASCIHYNDSDGWCKLMGLPSTVNPVFTFGTGMIGMACMGAGRQTAGQTELDV